MRWKSDLILLVVAAIWGTGFVAQRLATEQLGTFYFNGGRFLLAGLLILPMTKLRWQGERKQIPWMMLAGTILFAAAGLQQAGLVTTSIGNASFITGLYVVLVPVILFVFWKKHIHWLSWVAVGVATVGVMFLSLQGEFVLSPGDGLVLIGAVMWALHIILVGRLARMGVDILWFSVIQFTVCGLLNFLLAAVVDPQGAQTLISSWQVVLYSAIFPIGLGFTLQIAGQKHAPPVDAAIILSMEAVFATLFGFLFLDELLTARQLFGCFLILFAMVLAQVRPVEEIVLEAA